MSAEDLLSQTEPVSDSVSVPRSLLAAVLDEAESNLSSVHGEFCISTDIGPDGRHVCDVERERINSLRLAAGIPGPE